MKKLIFLVAVTLMITGCGLKKDPFYVKPVDKNQTEKIK
jgi:predicted small lipoprotein YifL